MEKEPHCPVCEANSEYHLQVPNWGEMRRCTSCGLTFADPMVLPESPEVLFEKAYLGKESRAGMQEYHRRLLIAEGLRQTRIDYNKSFLNAATQQVINFIKAEITPGSVVFNIGTGPGVFLTVLYNLGYQPVGLDVSKTLVEHLQKVGYKMWHGTIDTVPQGWVRPKAIVVTNVLHHLSDPMSFLKTIRCKYPKAVLLINQASNEAKADIARPPRAMSWWEPRSLHLAVEKAGYNVEITTPPRLASEFGFGSLTTFYITLTRVIPLPTHFLLRIYYKVKPYILSPLVLLGKLRNKRGSMLAIGYPRKAQED